MVDDRDRKHPKHWGPRGRAWECDITSHQSTCLSHALLHLPYECPAWNHFIVSLITLVDVEDQPPARKQYEGAKYELIIGAVDPTRSPDPDPTEPNKIHMLSPMNHVVQFHVPTDEDAKILVDKLVWAFIYGHESLDEMQRARIKQVVEATAKHYRGECSGCSH